MSRLSCLLVLLVVAGWPPARAEVVVREVEIALPGGETVPVIQAGGGPRRLLWLPSDFGVGPGHRRLAARLAGAGLSVWVTDLHSAYFTSPGPGSVTRFRAADIAALMDRALDGARRLYLVSSGAGARPALQAARRWQLDHPGDRRLGGVILFHPQFYLVRPAPGEPAVYDPILEATNLPVVILQPTRSTTIARVEEVARRLRRGGARVRLRILEGVKDGYAVRPPEQLDPADRAARRALPADLKEALAWLDAQPVPKRAAAQTPQARPAPQRVVGLKAFRPPRAAPPLALGDMNGRRRRLADWAGRVVVVSFWASWCPPCVKEMPAQERLQKELGPLGLTVLAVNVGEDRSRIEAFLKRRQVTLTILQDPDRRAYSDWQVYVIPTNFILDRRGRVRFGAVGALDWDDPELRGRLRRLLDETP